MWGAWTIFGINRLVEDRQSFAYSKNQRLKQMRPRPNRGQLSCEQLSYLRAFLLGMPSFGFWYPGSEAQSWDSPFSAQLGAMGKPRATLPEFVGRVWFSTNSGKQIGRVGSSTGVGSTTVVGNHPLEGF